MQTQTKIHRHIWLARANSTGSEVKRLQSFLPVSWEHEAPWPRFKSEWLCLLDTRNITYCVCLVTRYSTKNHKYLHITEVPYNNQENAIFHLHFTWKLQLIGSKCFSSLKVTHRRREPQLAVCIISINTTIFFDTADLRYRWALFTTKTCIDSRCPQNWGSQ